MKEVLLFVLEDCPYCRQALAWQRELLEENPHFGKIPLKIVDEGKEPDLANAFDYYFVPTYYVGGEKRHEGAADKEKIRKILAEALKS